MTTAYPRWGLSDNLLAAIGSVGISWGSLDHETGKLATYLFTAPYTSDSHIITGTVGFKDRLALIRALAYERVTNKEAFTDLDLLLGFIENELRTERNRVTHDLWISGGNLRIQLKPRYIKKPYAAREMKTYHETDVAPDDVATLSLLINDVAVAIGRAAISYLRLPSSGPDSWPGIFEQPIANLNQRYRQNP